MSLSTSAYDVASDICQAVFKGKGVMRTFFVDGLAADVVVGRCRLKPVESCVESAWSQRLKLKYDELLSNVAFNFILRPFIVSPVALEKALLRISISKKNKLSLLEYPAGRCSLTL